MQYLSLQEPRIIDFEPKMGPISGGTRITVRGHHMDAGTTITVSVVGIPCNVTRYKATKRPLKGLFTLSDYENENF